MPNPPPYSAQHYSSKTNYILPSMLGMSKQGITDIFTPTCPFRRKMVRRRHSALGFLNQITNFVQSHAEDLESEVRAYLANINSCTNHSVSTIWLGAFLENRRKPHQRNELTLTCLTVLTVMLEHQPPRGTGSHHNRDGVKAAIRALRMSSSEYSDYIQDSGSASRRRERSNKAMRGLDADYLRV